MNDPTRMGVVELAAAVRTGALSAAEIVEAQLARCEAIDPGVGAFLEVWHDDARAAARRVDEARARGEAPGPLAGVPVAIKDNFAVQGKRCTCASKILDGFVAPYTAAAVERLQAAGAIPFGRTNMDEFAMGSSTEHSALQTTRNPFALDHAPGGSSGGSAAAVAARLAPAALGSDTGGSVRQPAALCGVSGLKPTYGRISRHGLVAFASSLDHVGLLARDAGDLALLLEVLAGSDGRDATAAPEPPPLAREATGGDLGGLTIGVPAEDFGAGVDDAVATAVHAALAELQHAGARLRPVSLPHTRFAIPAYYVIADAEASSNLSRYDGVRYGLRRSGDRDLDAMVRDTRTQGFGAEVKRRILLGTFALSAGSFEAYYLQACKVRTLLQRDFEQAFAECDLLASPTSPFPAFPLGQKVEDPVQMIACDVLTAPANLAGIPALSVPCGQTAAGLPIGLQLSGPWLGESVLLRVAATLQSRTRHHLREPAL